MSEHVTRPPEHASPLQSPTTQLVVTETSALLAMCASAERARRAASTAMLIQLRAVRERRVKGMERAQVVFR